MLTKKTNKIIIVFFIIPFLFSCNNPRKKNYFIENNKGNLLHKIQGKVIKIADGDTFTILIEIANNGGFIKQRIRLTAIDAPEKKQPFSKKSKQFLSKLIFGKTVDVYYKKKDRYGRILGNVYIGNLNVNYEMVKEGYAWHFKKYSDDRKLAELENQARRHKKGLWQAKDPIPPWKWRKSTRK